MPKTRLVLAAAVAGLIALAGCSNEEPKPGAQQPEKQTQTGTDPKNENVSKPKSNVTEAQLKTALGKVDLGSADIGHGVKRQNHEADLDAPTNDICGKSWPSNSSRIARDQGYFWKSAKVASLVVSNEAVAYAPGKGSGVLAEIEKAIGSCDKWKHDQGEMTGIHIVEPPSGALPDSFAWQGKDERKGVEYSYLAVYQTNGDLLSAVYIWSKDKNELADVADQVTPKAASMLKDALTK